MKNNQGTSLVVQWIANIWMLTVNKGTAPRALQSFLSHFCLYNNSVNTARIVIIKLAIRKLIFKEVRQFAQQYFIVESEPWLIWHQSVLHSNPLPKLPVLITTNRCCHLPSEYNCPWQGVSKWVSTGQFLKEVGHFIQVSCGEIKLEG